jgi:conjugative relaxase-like TrwC/TraI family protein
MLAVSKLTPGQEAYYERSAAAGLDEYYEGGGESPGVWAGREAAELELEGVVEEGELGRLINGHHPRTAAELRRHPPKRVITVERIDPETGERRLERKTLAPVAGYDLVFSPPKSVSLLHALGDAETRHAVNQAHLAAWQAALAYLEREACVTRKGKDGVVRERASGFVAAAYQHRTSRAQDPHLHTHVIVANLARRPDGVWRALDGELLLRTYRLAAGYLYQTQLRFELTQSLGVEWREPAQGMAEIPGVPEEALQAFSRRRGQVLDHLERQGTSGFYAAKVAAVATRERKEPLDLPRLAVEWRARAAEHGLGRRELKRVLGRALHRELDERGFREVARRLLGPDGLTERRTTFNAAEAVMAWAEAHVQGAPVERVLELADRMTSMEQVVPVAAAAPGHPAAFSTAELLRHERAALALVARGRRADAPTVSPASVEQVARERAATLGPEQAAMLRAAGSSPDRVVSVVGRAGAGKTTALAAVAEAFHRDGFTVVGAAPSGLAAEKLTTETGIPSGTLHRLLAEGGRNGGLPSRCVLVVDEAGMADTRMLARALGQVERAGGKAILVGDPAQLPAVGAGGLFAAIVDRQGAVELSDNHRQRDELERRALELLRSGESHEYLVRAAERGRLVVANERTEAKALLVADWWQAARDDLAGSVMVAYRRRDVADLNAVAHTLMDAEGRLGRERLFARGLELAVGDRVVCARNDRRLGIANGTRGTIAALDSGSRAIMLETDEGRRLGLPAAYVDAGHIGYAYALTGHKTQGLTVESAFVLAGGEGSLKEWGYVALSRARAETRLYTTLAEVEPDKPPLYQPEPPEPVDRLADALARPAAETLALDATQRRSGSRPPSERARLLGRGRELGQRRQALEKRHLEASRELHAVKCELVGLGIIGRARHGPRLREQIAERRATLARLETELGRLDRDLQIHRQRLAREAPRLAPEPPRRELTRGRSRQVELDLGL